ncbi:MAG: 30S ribosomal protein S6 [Bdellovibrio sp.]|nr:MAG: 30S ribosomal protein S6 [Bdellovibrio sp.]
MEKLNVKKPVRKYEAVIIFNPDVPEEEQKEFFRKNRDIIKSFRGEVNHIDTWGKRRLSNPINKFSVGTYFHTTFEADPACIAELERTMRINDKVLRFFHHRLDDRISFSDYLDKYKETLALSTKKEQEKEQKAQARKAKFNK